MYHVLGVATRGGVTAADRFCRNCGHELREEDAFCSGCGRPTHETASVPTPEADTAVPTPPAATDTQRAVRAPSRAGLLLVGGIGVLLVLALIGVGLAALGGVGGLFAGEQEGIGQEAIEEAGQQPVAGSEEPNGYVLLPEEDMGAYGELLFLQLVREGADMPGGGQAIRGYLSNTTAYFDRGLPVAQVQTNPVEGTMDDASLQFTEEQYTGGASASVTSTYYYGTIEGSRMELTRDIPGAKTTWVGEKGTLEDYHEEVERLVREAQEEAQDLPSQ